MRAYCTVWRVCPTREEEWGPAGSERVPGGQMLTGCLGEPGWMACPCAASGHQVLSRLLSHVSKSRETQGPAPVSLGCGGPDKPLVFLRPFPGNAWPDHGLAALSRVVIALSRTLPEPAAGVSLRLTVGLGMMLLAAASNTLSRGGGCQAFPVPQIWTCSPASWQWGPPLQGEGALCQSRTSALDFPCPPHPGARVGAWRSAQEILSE